MDNIIARYIVLRFKNGLITFTAFHDPPNICIVILEIINEFTIVFLSLKRRKCLSYVVKFKNNMQLSKFQHYAISELHINFDTAFLYWNICKKNVEKKADKNITSSLVYDYRLLSGILHIIPVTSPRSWYQPGNFWI